MTLLTITAVLFAGVVLGVLISAAAFYVAVIKEFAGAVETHVAPALANTTEKE